MNNKYDTLNKYNKLEGKYKGLKYIVYYHVYATSSHFCGYVKLPDDHPYTKLIHMEKYGDNLEMEIGYDDMDIDCHGGLTFSRKITKENMKEYPQGFTPGYWIGWDYAHWGDYLPGMYPDGERHTFQEVEEECKKVIDQVTEKGKEENK